MTKKLWKHAGLFVITLLLCMTAARPVFAANKTFYYTFATTSRSEYNQYGDALQYGQVYYARIKNNKLILKGTLERYSSQNTMHNSQPHMLSEKKRVFKITKNTKYYTTAGENVDKLYESCRVSKKNFNRCLKELYGMEVHVKVKNGKVIYMEMHN